MTTDTFGRRNRQTGTVVELVDNREGGVCVDHGGVCSHATRALAESFLSVPREWCPTCQEDDE